MKITGKVAVITGASRGIGKATAIELAQRGAFVIVNYRGSEAAALETVAEIKSAGGDAVCMAWDVSDYAECEKNIKQIIDTFGRIDILVNNAGITRDDLLMKLSEEDFDAVIAANLKGTFCMLHFLSRQMLRQRSGKIINISSIWGDAGASCEVLYSTTKGGINAFTKALAKEVAASNIQVNAIAFGMIDTEMNAEFDEEDLALIKEEIPADYIASPKEAAQMVYHVATSPAYMTGQVITFSGGWY